MDELTLPQDAPRADMRDNVLAIPYTRPWVGGIDVTNAPSHARILRGDSPIDEFPAAPPEPVNHEPGTFLYGGPLYVHFGHLIVDSIPRLYAFDAGRHKGAIFPLLGDRDAKIWNWVYDVMGLFGLSRQHVYVVREPTRFARVEFAEPASVLKRPDPGWYLAYLERVSFKRCRTPPNVYLGRTHIAHKGTMLGESYFGDLLIGNSFEYIKPETLDIHAQLSLIANARNIVFAEGSSIYTAFLLPKIDANVFMIPRRPGGANLFAAQLRQRGTFHVLGEPRDLVRLANLRGSSQPNSPSYTLNPQAIHHSMVMKGLIQGDFDLDAFLDAERSDVLTYYGSAAGQAAEQLRLIYEMRQRSKAY